MEIRQKSSYRRSSKLEGETKASDLFHQHVGIFQVTWDGHLILCPSSFSNQTQEINAAQLVEGEEIGDEPEKCTKNRRPAVLVSGFGVFVNVCPDFD